MKRDLLDPQRERRIETPFGIVPCRLITDGHLSRMSLPEIALYLFFSLASDRRGMCFCSDCHLRDVLRLTDDEINWARRSLKHNGLLAFTQDRYVVTYQLLSLPLATPASPPLRTRLVTEADADAIATPTTTAPPVSQLQPVRQPHEAPHFDVTHVRHVIAMLSEKMALPETTSEPRRN